ncbi:MAG: hypothetical protein HY908_20765 [Myxococcales bacterium]|nr:hypothetical protein [Myxococcales bacterium]
MSSNRTSPGMGALGALAVCAAALAAASACKSDGDGNNTTTTTSTTSTTGSGASGGGGGNGTGGTGLVDACPGPGYESPTPTQETVGAVSAIVQLPGGAPATNITGTVCGLNICIYGTPAANGNILIDVGAQLMIEPRFTWGDGLDYPKLAAHIPTFPAHDFGVVNTAALPALTGGGPMTAGASWLSNGASLTIDVGALVEFDYLIYPDEPQHEFRAVEIPTNGTAIPALQADLELVYGFSPIHTHICPAAGLILPNPPAWAAGTVVEFFLHGTTVFQDFAPYGGWAKIAEGTVSADGLTVSTSPGEGVTELDVIGVRVKP